ncbi:MAG: hypothetical protein VZR73_05085 [Acutalibacteraceae bacterium]|nr:hypothetical protein [Clostridia bacterium]MEE3403437.1 hypothetical protein [Acutalibacteraceae bacterium]HCA54614.1 hypothetical protein [Oscillospiraceae bacterium]
MQLNDPCVNHILHYLADALKTKNTVSFNDVMGAAACKRYSVREIGQALELLRRNGLVKADSRFGCSELLSFTAKAITEAGWEYLKKH